METVSSIASIAMKNAALYEKMFREARIDPLTGVYNYRFFVERLEEQFGSYGRECLTLMYIDVDDFKLYNQLYGVGEGDTALCRIGEAITRSVGEGGTVFRTSGKVFAVLLPLQDTQRARTLARGDRKQGERDQPDAGAPAAQASVRQRGHLLGALRRLQCQRADG